MYYYCQLCNINFYQDQVAAATHWREHELVDLKKENNRLVEQNNKLLKILIRKLG